MKKIWRKEKRREKGMGRFRNDSWCGFIKIGCSALLGPWFWPLPSIKQ